MHTRMAQHACITHGHGHGHGYGHGHGHGLNASACANACACVSSPRPGSCPHAVSLASQELMLHSSIDKLRRRRGSSAAFCAEGARSAAAAVLRPVATFLDEQLPILGTSGAGPGRRAWEGIIFVVVFYTAVCVPVQVPPAPRTRDHHTCGDESRTCSSARSSALICSLLIVPRCAGGVRVELHTGGRLDGCERDLRFRLHRRHVRACRPQSAMRSTCKAPM